jgi:hypothetical protein
MNRLFIAGFLLSLVPASASTITASLGGQACGTAGQCTSVAGAHTITFDGLDGTSSPYTSGIATFTFSSGSPFVTGSASGEFAAPPLDETTYLSVGSPGRANPVTISFSAPIAYYGFYLGSPDTYNLVRFFSGQNQIAAFTGGDLLPLANGDQSLGAFVNFNVTGGSIDRMVLSSSQPALETDNHAYAVATPEPASLGLAGIGLAFVYFGSRRKRSA